MKSAIRLFPFLSLSVLIFYSCEGEGIEYIEANEGYALSAGTSTIYSSTSHAYDTEAPWVTGTPFTRFNRGDQLYDDGPTENHGLGPVYAG